MDTDKLVNFAGAKPSNVIDMSDEWETVYDDGDKVLQTIRTYSYDYPEDSELKFRYKYLITSNSLPDNEGMNLIALSLVICPDDLCTDVKNSILSSTDGYCEYSDVLAYGTASIYIDNAIIKEGDEADTISLMQNVISAIDALFGFYIDKYVNRLGSTGWNVIRYAVGLEKSWF